MSYDCINYKTSNVYQDLPDGIIGGLQSLEPEVVEGVEVAQLCDGVGADVRPLKRGGHEGVVEPGDPE